jgi:hypothetical protein
VISKNLSILGSPDDKPILQPSANFTGNNAANAWFLVEQGINFELANTVMDGNGLNVWQAVR